MKDYLYACKGSEGTKDITPFYYKFKSAEELKQVLRCVSLVKDIKIGVVTEIPEGIDAEEVNSPADFVQKVADNTEVGYCIKGMLLSFVVALRNNK